MLLLEISISLPKDPKYILLIKVSNYIRESFCFCLFLMFWRFFCQQSYFSFMSIVISQNCKSILQDGHFMGVVYKLLLTKTQESSFKPPMTKKMEQQKIYYICIGANPKEIRSINVKIIITVIVIIQEPMGKKGCISFSPRSSKIFLLHIIQNIRQWKNVK